MRRFAEGRMELTRREREARIAASGGDVEKHRRKQSAKEHHRQDVLAKREKLRGKWTGSA